MRPATEKHLALLGQPAIAAALPFVGPDGTRWEKFTGTCPGCNSNIPAEAMHGSIYKGIADTATLEAVAMCKPCGMLVPFFLRFRKDGTWQSISPAGEWVVGHKRTSLLGTAQRFLRKILRIDKGRRANR